MKRSLMELGGKSANLVFADSDQERALRNSMSPWTFHSGQICTAPTRLLVEQSIYREFSSKLVEAAAALEIGDPRKQGVVVDFRSDIGRYAVRLAKLFGRTARAAWVNRVQKDEALAVVNDARALLRGQVTIRSPTLKKVQVSPGL